VRLGWCEEHEQPVRTCYVRVRGRFTPVGFYCPGCGFSESRIVAAFQTGYGEVRRYRVSIRDGRIARVEVDFWGNPLEESG